MLDIVNYTGKNEEDILSILRKRGMEKTVEIQIQVKEIIENVKLNGDKALHFYTNKFDGTDINDFQVSKEEFKEAYDSVDKEFIDILEESKKNIEEYHKNQKYSGYIYTKELGIFMGQRVIPLSKVGIYVPGGTAAYPSSVLMNAIPAKVAEVGEIIMVTPPDSNGKINPYILVASKIAGVDKVYKVGGAQAIAALTYGTETLPKVEKIVGPGNIYVSEAKRLVYGEVGIDMIAGPSEIVVIADEKANGKYIAADLMSQAEHDKLASSILLTTSISLADEVVEEVQEQIINLKRNSIIQESISKYGRIIICKDVDAAIKLANIIAPEHLEILTESPMGILGKIKNAASIFLGEYTPEPVGDYFGGTNHVLPTHGTARFSSPLSVDAFVKKSSFLYYSKEALFRDGEKIIKMSDIEGLTAHGNAVKVRLSDENN